MLKVEITHKDIGSYTADNGWFITSSSIDLSIYKEELRRKNIATTFYASYNCYIGFGLDKRTEAINWCDEKNRELHTPSYFEIKYIDIDYSTNMLGGWYITSSSDGIKQCEKELKEKGIIGLFSRYNACINGY